MKLRNKKTGEIVNVESLGHADSLKEKYGYQVTLMWKTEYGNLPRCKDYNSLAELNDEWEDYTPDEPLIKDEKNRKVVRAWLEANDLDGAAFHKYSHFFHYWNLRGFNDNGMGVDIDFFLTGEGIPNLIDGKYYTKFELCGEEEG